MTKSKSDDKNDPQIYDHLASLSKLRKKLGITNWDVMVVGDGSGSGWQLGAGWAAVLVDKYSGCRKLFYGAMNTGTVTLGELFPYLHALSWYTAKDGPGRTRLKDAKSASKKVGVHLVTDSQAVATAGNNPNSRHAHRELWTAFDEYQRRGFAIQFHHVARELVDLNILVDAIARQARLSLTDTYDLAIEELRKHYPGIPEGVTIYDFS